MKKSWFLSHKTNVWIFTSPKEESIRMFFPIYLITALSGFIFSMLLGLVMSFQIEPFSCSVQLFQFFQTWVLSDYYHLSFHSYVSFIILIMMLLFIRSLLVRVVISIPDWIRRVDDFVLSKMQISPWNVNC